MTDQGNRLKEPHLLCASNNPLRLLRNLEHLLDQTGKDALKGELQRNVRALYELGEEHFLFAAGLSSGHWRQQISRFYYGAYHYRRAVNLAHRGWYSTDSSDHQKVGNLPAALPNKERYQQLLKDLRTDRNLSDYNHDATRSELLHTTAEVRAWVSDFGRDAKNYLASEGYSL